MNEKEAMRLMEAARSGGAEFADARCVDGFTTAVEIQDGRVERVHAMGMRGVGVRALVDGVWGFASVNADSLEDGMRCVAEALEMAAALKGEVVERSEVAEQKPHNSQWRSDARRNPAEVPVETKVRALIGIEESARKYDERIANTFLSYSDGARKTLLVNTFGTAVTTESTRTRVAVRVIARDGDLRQTGYESVGRLEGFELIEDLRPEDLSLKASRRAVNLLSAAPPPSGNFPVIFDHSVTGLLVHEAFGHNSEADLVWSGESIISDRIGKRIGSELLNIIDDPTLPGAWGTYAYDEEGTPAVRRVLVENGVVKGLLHSLETAARFGADPNGAARAQNHQFRPIIRMSNTFIAAGATPFEQLLKSTDEGIYVKGALSGYVATEKGQFTCRTAEAWTVKNGELDKPLRDVAVSGLTLEALENIDAVSDAMELSMPGTCGKGGQGVPVDTGGPHVRLKQLIVGGAA